MNKLRSNTMQGLLAVILVLLLILGSVFYSSEASAQAGGPWQGIWAKGAHVPVIINLYPNCNVTEAEAKTYIKEANDILKQAHIHLHPIKTNLEADINALPNKGGDADGNGRFPRGERKNIRDFGEHELNTFNVTPEKPGNKKGVKISFGNAIEYYDEEAKQWKWNALGFAWPCTYRTMLVRKTSAQMAKDFGRTIAKDTGVTIAHELGHILSIKDHSNGADHLMHPQAKGTKLTKEQIDEMWKEVKKIGKCSVQWSRYEAAIKAKHQHGTTTDARGDAATSANPISDIADLLLVFLTSLDGLPTIDAQMTVAGVLPTDKDLNLVYSLGLNTDRNTATGVPYAGSSGIDRIVYVYAMGNVGLGTFSLSGEVKNTHNGEVTPLSDIPLAEPVYEHADRDDGWVSIGTSILFTVPKPLLGPLAAEVPVVATGGTESVILDTASFEFDTERWLKDPTFTTSGTGVPTPGQGYPFQVSGLEPNDSFNLYLNDTLMLSGTLDGDGGYSGSFVIPSDLPNNVVHFLTAQDSTGEFAYTITCPREEIVGWLSVRIDGLAVLAPWIALLAVIMAGASLLVIGRRRTQN